MAIKSFNPWRMNNLTKPHESRNLGVGTIIPKRMFRTPIIAQHIQGLLNSSDLTAQCRKMMGHFQGRDPLEETCQLIETTFGIA